MEMKEHNDGTLRYLTVEPDGYRRGDRCPLVVLLHGYGSHMGDLASLAPAIGADGYIYAFPNAPHPLDVGYGAVGFAWAGFPQRAGDQAMAKSERGLEAFFDEVVEEYQVADGQVVLGGFSQGGMLSLQMGLIRPDRFRGLVVLSGKLPDSNVLPSGLPQRRDQAIFMAHGTQDTMIPVEDARRTLQWLETNSYSPDYHEYEMAHEISPEEIADLARWLRSLLPPAGGSVGSGPVS